MPVEKNELQKGLVLAQEVNKLMKQFNQMSKMMKMMQGGGGKKMMQMMQGMK